MGQVHTHSRDDLLDLPYVIPGDQAPQYRGVTPFRQARPIIYKHGFAQTKFNFSNTLGLQEPEKISTKKFEVLPTTEEVKMRNLRSVIFGLGCVLGGAFLANYFGAEVGAQQQTVTEAQSWELTVGRYHTSNLDRIPHSGR